MVELDDKSVAEIKTCTHNFAPDISDPLVTLSGPTFVKSQLKNDAGTVADAGASALTIGTNQIIGQKLLVLYGAGLEGNRYRVRALVTGSDGQKLESVVEFTVRDSAA